MTWRKKTGQLTREQWHSMSRPTVSGIAIDTLLFSRIGMPLFHQYQVFDRQGTHAAFRGTYMHRLFDYLKESDAESLRQSHWHRDYPPRERMTRPYILLPDGEFIVVRFPECEEM